MSINSDLTEQKLENYNYLLKQNLELKKKNNELENKNYLLKEELKYNYDDINNKYMYLNEMNNLLDEYYQLILKSNNRERRRTFNYSKLEDDSYKIFNYNKNKNIKNMNPQYLYFKNKDIHRNLANLRKYNSSPFY